MTAPSPAADRPRAGGPAVIYLDHAATAPLCDAAADAVRGALALYGNPSSSHGLGAAAREAVDGARDALAELLGCLPVHVVLTSCGSEAVTTALLGTCAPWSPGGGGHLVTTAIEHSAGLESARALRRRGVEVTVVPPGASGHVDPQRIADALRPDTRLVSVMHANNETGAIQPVAEITRLAHDHGAVVHVDAVQTAGKLPLHDLDADLVSVSGHKFGGPKGVGALRLADGLHLEPLVLGGGQEGGRRAGTENVPGVLGMAAAARVALARQRSSGFDAHRRLARDAFMREIADLPGLRTNVSGPVMPEILSLTFVGVRGDTLADVLDLDGICVSTGSACHAGTDSPSHVLTAMGFSVERARSTVRFSFGWDTTGADVARAAEALTAAVPRLRRVASGIRDARPEALAVPGEGARGDQ